MNLRSLAVLPPILLCLSAQATGAAPQESGPPQRPGPWLELPDEPLGRLWASVGEDTEPLSLRGIPAASWVRGAPESWAVWSRALDDLDGLPAERRGAVANLVALALTDGRANDAFRWLEAFGSDDPSALAGMLPRLFPGVPIDVALGPGGVPGHLPEGTVLRPCLPPAIGADTGRIEARRATCRGLEIGGARFDLQLKVDGSGVVCDVTHLAGDEATLRLQLPVPEGWRLATLYLDWEQQTPPAGADPDSFDWGGEILEIPLRPAEPDEDGVIEPERLSVFARVRRVELPLPSGPAAGLALPKDATEAGLLLCVPASGADGEPWEAIAAAWGAGAGLDVAIARLERGAPPPAPLGLQGLVLRFHEAARPVALRRRITGALEKRALGAGD